VGGASPTPSTCRAHDLHLGYDEVHPIVTPLLRNITMGTIVLGCTGMIFFTSSLVQFITINQLQLVLEPSACKAKSTSLKTTLSCAVRSDRPDVGARIEGGAAQFVILERSENRAAEAVSWAI